MVDVPIGLMQNLKEKKKKRNKKISLIHQYGKDEYAQCEFTVSDPVLVASYEYEIHISYAM